MPLKSKKFMAKVHYLDPLDYLSGKITKRHRTTYCYRQTTDRRYTTVYTTPTGAPTAAQQSTKQKFSQAAQQTNAIMMDINQLDPYRQAWHNLIRSGNHTYSTLRGYIFAQVYKTL